MSRNSYIIRFSSQYDYDLNTHKLNRASHSIMYEGKTVVIFIELTLREYDKLKAEGIDIELDTSLVEM